MATNLRVRDLPVPAGFDMRDHVSGVGAHLAGPANVIMQLSWPGVGYGVMNSRVHDGAAMRRPFKRGRTTFTYLAVALLGTDDDRAAFRKEVNRQHAQVVSRPDEKVQYRAMDPRLQTWVAACLYYGTVDMIERMHGPLPDAEADALYAHCARFGTTLQMPADAWPADREAFRRYWEEAEAEVDIDPAVASYLMDLTRLRNFPRPFRPLGPFVVFVTTGFLPPLFREAMGLTWTAGQQRRFDRLLRTAGAVERRLPRFLRNFPFNLWLADLRLRRRFGRRLV
ncbi:oxygenase MpaB family protein [Nocardioides sp. LHD-245]|uniref:oxygenase MpaB family protein n=1 Tax=Nocardioides sp. LHD-245 TaxID=3051387 RepID=UPI0027DF386F|nr:oxygenase MpaB family protein [Nocardioides sp. LHD-245]